MEDDIAVAFPKLACLYHDGTVELRAEGGCEDPDGRTLFVVTESGEGAGD